MRAVVAKRIRKAAYGDLSLREPRKYVVRQPVGGLINVGPRAVYQRMKAQQGR